MKDFIEKTQLMNKVTPPLNVDPDLVTENILEITCNLQELIQLGFTYDSIDFMLSELLENDRQFKNTIVSTILSRK